jgi:hypothetical protein
MANYPQSLAQNAECESVTGRLTGLWFLPKPAQGLNTNQSINQSIFLSLEFSLRTTRFGIQKFYMVLALR